MARGDGLARQFELWMLLDQERELSVEDAARRLGCTRRTIYRHLFDRIRAESANEVLDQAQALADT